MANVKQKEATEEGASEETKSKKCIGFLEIFWSLLGIGLPLLGCLAFWKTSPRNPEEVPSDILERKGEMRYH